MFGKELGARGTSRSLLSLFGKCPLYLSVSRCQCFTNFEQILFVEAVLAALERRLNLLLLKSVYLESKGAARTPPSRALK